MLIFLAASYGLQQGKRAEMSSKWMLVRFILVRFIEVRLFIFNAAIHCDSCRSSAVYNLMRLIFCEYYSHVGMVH